MVLAAAPALPAHLPAALPTSAHSAANPAPNGWVTHKVRPGDTLISLAATFRTTPAALAARNRISNPRALLAGSTIEVPRLGAAPRPAATAQDTRGASGSGTSTYTVKKGDTLSGIAAAHRMSVPALIKANKLQGKRYIFPGQRLIVGAVANPAGGSSSNAPAKQNPAKQAPASGSSGKTTNSFDTTFPGGAPRHTNSVSENRRLLNTATVPSRSATRELIIATARAHGVDQRLALAIAMNESGWNQRNVSWCNAIGVMQVIPAGGSWASSLSGKNFNLLDTRQNVAAGVVMLRGLGSMAKSEDEVIAAYYQGLTSVRKNGMFNDTKRYVANVKALKGRM